jgi:hypothetical protein
LQHNEVFGSFVNGVIQGAIIGIGQWFLLRKYLPSWLWIVAASIGYGFSLFMLNLCNIWFLPNFFEPETWGNSFIILGCIVAIIKVFCWVLLGLAQLLVIRQEVRVPWWWTFVPVIGNLICFFLVLPFIFLAQSNSYIGFSFIFQRFINPLVLGAIMGATEGLSLSTLSKKASDINSSSCFIPNSLLTLAPDISDSRQIKILSKKLFTQINQAWKTETTSTQELIYIVGMAQDGTIVAYQPINQAAVDYINQTPLADLVGTFPLPSLDATYQESLAKFQVVFVPPGSIKIRPWRTK